MSIAVIGKPGSGKTHFARYLARKLDRAVFEYDDVTDSVGGNSPPVMVTQREQALPFRPVVLYKCERVKFVQRCFVVKKMADRNGIYKERGWQFFSLADGRFHKKSKAFAFYVFIKASIKDILLIGR